MTKLATVTVLYHPTEDAFITLRALAKTDFRVIAVVNEADSRLCARLREIEYLEVISNETNLGLATALNQGLRHAFSDPSIAYVLLLDQDSKPSGDLVNALAQALERATALGHNPACVAPTLRDRKRPNAWVGDHHRAMRSAHATELAPTVSTATSGTLIERRAFEKIGPMLEPLFIDGIDHEWCLRAKSLGFTTLIATRSIMDHDMGEGALEIFGRFKPLHRSPVRHYYIVRNSLLLSRAPYIPLRWKIVELLKTVRRIAAYVLISRSKVASIRMIAKGIADGLRGRAGKLNETIPFRFYSRF